MPPLWYPFRSPEVTDICSNLEPGEEAELTRIGRQDGFLFGVAIASPILVSVVFSSHHGIGSITVMIASQVAIAAAWIPWMNQRKRVFLASTKYARARGFTPATIRFHSLGNA